MSAFPSKDDATDFQCNEMLLCGEMIYNWKSYTEAWLLLPGNTIIVESSKFSLTPALLPGRHILVNNSARQPTSVSRVGKNLPERSHSIREWKSFERAWLYVNGMRRCTLTLCRRGLQPLAQSLHTCVVLLNFDHCLRSSELHEGTQLHERAAKSSRMVAVVSLVLGVKIAIRHVPHGGWVLLGSLS